MSSGEQILRDYLAKLSAHDIAGCLSCFAEDSVIESRAGTARGLREIEQWHQERFNAKLAVLSVESVNERDQEAAANMTITSERFAGRRLESVPVRLTLSLAAGKIAAARLEFRVGAGLKNLLGFR